MMTFVPILDLLLFHTSSDPQLLYRHARTAEENSHNMDLLFGSLQSLKVLCGRIKEQHHHHHAREDPAALSSLSLSTSSTISFDPTASSFKCFKTPFYSLYFFESATGFQIVLIVGLPVENQNSIKGPHCRANILDVGSGEGSQGDLAAFLQKHPC